MVDEKTSTRALSGSRRLNKPIPRLSVDYDPATGEWDSPQQGGKSWLPVPGAFASWYVEDYLDTSGYTRDELTTVPRAIYTQQAGRVNFAQPGNTRLIVFDMVLTERLTDLTGFVAEFTATNSRIPGFPTSTYDWTQVMYGRYRQYTGINQAAAIQDVLGLVQDDAFGSLEATTADKLWTYKIVILLGIPGATGVATLNVPPSRIIADVDIVKEGDLEFMMRQKRSYELTNY